MGSMQKLRSAVFYLKSPVYWAHFSHRALRYFQSDLDSASYEAKARQWARERAQPLAALLAQFGLTASPKATLPAMDPDLLKAAKRRAERARHKMGGAGHIDLIYAITRLTAARACLETGVAYGWSSLAFLAAMEKNGEGRLVSVDRPYPGMGNEGDVGIVVAERFKHRWILVREPDRNGLRRAAAALPQGADITHYDSDKSYRGRMFGYAILWKALKPGGIFISDDIQDNMAFADFMRQKDASFGVVEGQDKYVGFAVKPASRG
jgi:predicted O-methyltransferase YrrM